jgi:hypothetical protein
MTPVGPYGAQRRLQQSPQLPQSVPSTPSLQYVAPLGGGAHTPTFLPAGIVQFAEQQSVGLLHRSPLWTQYEPPRRHLPPLQSPEQQSPLPAHVLPADLQPAVVESGAHAPAAQDPLQHAASLEHAFPSTVHAACAHLPLTQLRLQHSVGEPHEAPAAAHAPVLATHLLVAASQSCEQQSAPVTQRPSKG